MGKLRHKQAILEKQQQQKERRHQWEERREEESGKKYSESQEAHRYRRPVYPTMETFFPPHYTKGIALGGGRLEQWPSALKVKRSRAANHLHA